MRMSKEESARYEGANWCLNKVKTIGLEATEEEFKWRNVYGCPLKIEKSSVEKFERLIRDSYLDLTKVIVVGVLTDKFDFTPEQIAKFDEELDKRADCIKKDYVSWSDLRDEIIEMYGIDIPLPEDRKKVSKNEDSKRSI